MNFSSLGLTFLWTIIIFRQKTFWTKSFFPDQNPFWPQCFLYPKYVFRSKMFLEPKLSLDQTFSCVPRINFAWTYVSGKVLPRAYSNNCSIGNKHFKISQNHLHLFVRVVSNSRKFLGLYTLKQGVCWGSSCFVKRPN